jgi:hypothetical protein
MSSQKNKIQARNRMTAHNYTKPESMGIFASMDWKLIRNP